MQLSPPYQWGVCLKVPSECPKPWEVSCLRYSSLRPILWPEHGVSSNRSEQI